MPPKQSRIPFTNFSTRIDLDTDARLQRLQIAMEKPFGSVLATVLKNYERNLLLRLNTEEKADYLDGLLDRSTMIAATQRARSKAQAANPSNGRAADWADK